MTEVATDPIREALGRVRWPLPGLERAGAGVGRSPVGRRFDIVDEPVA